MGIKARELGVISVDAGDVVCFSMDEVIRMAGDVDDVDRFIKRHKGVECDFRADGGYGVDQVTAVQQDGKTFDMILIGGDSKNLRRFLREDEPNFHEFFEAHPRVKEVGHGEDFNHEIFAEISKEYHEKLVSDPTNLQQ